MATISNLQTLKINYLTQQQYDTALANGQINSDELYFTPAGAATPAEHSHGDISNNGTLSTTAITPASGDYIVMTDSSNSHKIQRGIVIGTTTTSFLANDGTWKTPPNTTYTVASSVTAVSTTSAVGTSTAYARADHVHNITLATGDSNGQVKIAGSNVSVKGLGTAAYTASTAYSASTHSHGVITNSGYVGTASNKALYTGTSGVITSGTLPVAAGGTGQTSVANIQAGKDGDGNTISSTYLKLSGGTVIGTLILSRATDAAPGSDNKPALIIGGVSTAEHIEIDSNEILAKSNGTTISVLYLQDGSGTVEVSGTGGLKVTKGHLVIGEGKDVVLKASSNATTDPGDILFQNASGAEIGRIYKVAGADRFEVRYNSSTAYKIYTAKEITRGTGNPSGGSDGDIYIKYTA